MTAIGATRANLLQQKANLERRRLELKAALGITHRRAHKNFKRKRNADADPELLREYRVTGESIMRLCEELARMREAAETEAVCA